MRSCSNEGILDLIVPGLYPQIPQTYDWNYTTVPQANVNNRSLAYRRGFVLGGSSSISKLTSYLLTAVGVQGLFFAQTAWSIHVGRKMIMIYGVECLETRRLGPGMHCRDGF